MQLELSKAAGVRYESGFLLMSSLRDIAQELDVSISLVSKVLNDRLGTTGVRPPLIRKIRATAERMGYQKNLSAVSLLERRQNAIAVFVHSQNSQGSGIVERLLDGISRATGERAQRISLEFFRDAADFLSKRESLHSGRVDGLIVLGVNHPELSEELVAIQKNGLPIVTIYNEPLHPDIQNVGIADAALSDTATTHLIALGCTRILHLSVLPAREEGHRAALGRAGLSVDNDLIIPMERRVGFRETSGANAIRTALQHGVVFDGVSAQSDAQAFGVINELTRQGRKVPNDIKVIGIDNAPFSELCIVPLSSVSQRFLDRGRLAVETLEALIKQGPVPKNTIEPRLHLRASTAPSP